MAAWCAELAGRTGPADLGPTAPRIRALLTKNAWRAEDDLVRRGLEWLAIAVGRDEGPARPAEERLFLRASIFLGDLAGDRAAAAGVREARIRLARRLPDEALERVGSPLALVNALARGQGLKVSTQA